MCDRTSEAHAPEGKGSKKGNESNLQETVKSEGKVNPSSKFEPPSVILEQSISRVEEFLSPEPPAPGEFPQSDFGTPTNRGSVEDQFNTLWAEFTGMSEFLKMFRNAVRKT